MINTKTLIAFNENADSFAIRVATKWLTREELVALRKQIDTELGKQDLHRAIARLPPNKNR